MDLEYIEYLIVPDQIQSDCKPEQKSPQPRAPTAQNPLVLASGFHFIYPKAWIYSLLFCLFSWPVLGLQKKVLKFPEKYFGGLVCSGGMAGGPPFPTAAFALSIQGRSGKGDTQEKRRCPRIIFMLFWLLVQFQISVGVSVHHQQQPFFFWGAFGTSSALFFNSSSRLLSNLMKLTMDSKTLWPEAALHS